MEDEQMKSAAIDIFSYIVEFSPSMVREYILQEGQRQDDVSDEGWITAVVQWIYTANLSLLLLDTLKSHSTN